MAPGRGRPAKRKPNTSGLRNQKPRTPTPEPEPALAEPEHSPDWPTDLASDDESEEEEANLAFEDGMRSKAASDVDIDSDVEVEDEQDKFSLATEALDDEVLLEKLLSQSEKVGEDADDEEWFWSTVFGTSGRAFGPDNTFPSVDFPTADYDTFALADDDSPSSDLPPIPEQVNAQWTIRDSAQQFSPRLLSQWSTGSTSDIFDGLSIQDKASDQQSQYSDSDTHPKFSRHTEGPSPSSNIGHSTPTSSIYRNDSKVTLPMQGARRIILMQRTFAFKRLRNDMRGLMKLGDLSSRNDELASAGLAIRDLDELKQKYEQAKTRIRRVKATSQLFIEAPRMDQGEDQLPFSGYGGVLDIHAVDSAVFSIVDDLRALEGWRAHERPAVVDLLTVRVAVTLRNLIAASKTHATSASVSPVSLLDATASHVAVITEIARTVDIRKSSRAQRKTAGASSSVTDMFLPGLGDIILRCSLVIFSPFLFLFFLFFFQFVEL
ncbi:hypothetical protein B0H14DRAFT_3878644 [Mycena olivaceomarginata]|nr:hypothetical protein B0H14DRAFT_3878644 [Mycena olivaceomarginata]